MIMEPKADPFWEDPPPLLSAHHGHSGTPANGTGHLQYDRNLNFATVTMDDGDYGFQKKKTVRDPLSHRIIEKRRRDRMNNCLADLARLLPQASLRKGRGRIEKTEIVELAIKHLKHLQTHPCPFGDNCEFNPMVAGKPSLAPAESQPKVNRSGPAPALTSEDQLQFRLGFQEALTEAMHFIVERNGVFAGEGFVLQLAQHLNNHCQLLLCENSNGRKPAHRALDLAIEYPGKVEPEGSYQGLTSPSAETGVEQKDSLPVELGVPGRDPSPFNYDADDNNSCSSTPLSVEVSDAYSMDGKPLCSGSGRSAIKPPIPSIIGSHSGSSAVLSSSNGRSSDEGSASTNETSNHRYKFKNNIKQRFTADLDATGVEGTGKWSLKHHRHSHHYHRSSKSKTSGPAEDTSSNPSEDQQAETETTTVSDSSEAVNLSTASTVLLPAVSDPGTAIPLPLVSVVSMASLREPEPEPFLKKSFKLMEEGQEGQTVPAFALHDKGLFYIPLTLDKALVAPFIAAAELSSPLPPLHPVTISVCFLLGPKEDPGQGSTADLSLSGINLSKGSGGEALFGPVLPPADYLLNRLAHSPAKKPQALTPGSRYFDAAGTERYAGTFPGTATGPARHQRNSYAGMSSPFMLGPSPSPYSYDQHSHTHSHSHSLHSSSSSSTSSGNSSLSGGLMHSNRNNSSRKRHILSPSSSSSLSMGYHSWRDGSGGHGMGHHSSSNTSGSAEGSHFGSYLNEMESRVEEDTERGHGGRGRSSGAGGHSPPKRQKKGRSDLNSLKPLNLM